MRRWFGVALLGLVAAVVGGVAGAILVNVHTDSGPDLSTPWPLALGQGIATVFLIGGVLAVLVGLVGAGVRAVRSH